VHVRPGPGLRGGHHRVRRPLQRHPVHGGARPEVHAHRLQPVRVPGIPHRPAQQPRLHIHLHTLDVPAHHVLHTVRFAGRAQRRHIPSGESDVSDMCESPQSLLSFSWLAAAVRVNLRCLW